MHIPFIIGLFNFINNCLRWIATIFLLITVRFIKSAFAIDFKYLKHSLHFNYFDVHNSFFDFYIYAISNIFHCFIKC